MLCACSYCLIIPPNPISYSQKYLPKLLNNFFSLLYTLFHHVYLLSGFQTCFARRTLTSFSHSSHMEISILNDSNVSQSSKKKIHIWSLYNSGRKKLVILTEKESITSLSLYLSLSLSLSLLLPLSLSLATSSPQHVCTSPPTILKCRESPTKLYKSFSFPCVYHLFPPDLLFSLREFNSDHSALWYFSFYLYIIVLKFIIPTVTFLWRNFHAVMLLFFLVIQPFFQRPLVPVEIIFPNYAPHISISYPPEMSKKQGKKAIKFRGLVAVVVGAAEPKGSSSGSSTMHHQAQLVPEQAHIRGGLESQVKGKPKYILCFRKFLDLKFQPLILDYGFSLEEVRSFVHNTTNKFLLAQYIFHCPSPHPYPQPTPRTLKLYHKY
ncbi:hypothetical protein VP01_2628g2 [Puccinia sorghi]|uniref:Uncharacterized protein n=1 Tax=Puccinia sorghi TaxID=27349 RepID=A0A0L6V4D4_9BASI|nr:hypothetical protein VP01_2628g2 [Puccinia sorghi]